LAARGLSPAAPAAAADRLPPMLTNAVQVLDLTTAQASQALPVRLCGVVIDESQPSFRAVILGDPSASIYVSARTNLFAPCHRNDLLEVQGVTSPGQFAPCVLATQVAKLGTGPVPPARPVTYQQLITGALDAQYVEIKGVVRQCLPPLPNDETWRIVLAADGGTIPVRIPLLQDARVQEDAEVTIDAVCLYQFNEKRQALTPVLQVPRGMTVRIDKLSPADPYSAPVRSADSLLQYSHDVPFEHRVHVRGVVTRSQPGAQVWIRDQSSGLRIQIHQTDVLQPGDEIDALGFPAYGSSSPLLEDALFRKTGAARPPAPIPVVNATNAFEFEDDLISIEAMISDVQPVLEGTALTLSSGATTFKALLKSSPANKNVPDWKTRSLVRLTGICDVIYDDTRPVMGIWHPQSFQILLRSPNDVTILKAPPWWTAGHIILILGIFAAGSLAVSGVLLSFARHRLNVQAHRRAMAEAEFAAILSERNRLAREIHDTLAQGLTATAVQLQLVKIHANGSSAPMNVHLEKAQQMVRDSLEEARNTIWKMRPQVLETNDLVTALKNILTQLAEGIADTRFEVTGRERRLPAIIEDNVLRLGQEAITNAVKHAGAKQIGVKVDFGEKHFSLAVVDDGHGFDPARPPKSEGGFGLVGMQERARELSGRLTVRSGPNQGTELSLDVPLAGE
jgi:signal transduction histidine kinase